MSCLKKAKIKVYTREAQEGYSSSLGNSVHLAYWDEGWGYRNLYHNYGILFAEAEISGTNEIIEKGLINPRICYDANRGYCITALRANADGTVDESCSGKVLLWTTEDFTFFHAHGLVEEVHTWTDSSEEVEVPEPVGFQALMYWALVRNTAVEVPEFVQASCQEDMEKVRALAMYSDGSVAFKSVDWDCNSVDWHTPGDYPVTGQVRSCEYGFPLAKGYADPDITYWDGAYYFIATNDNTDDVGLYIRRADTVAELFAEEVAEYLILNKDPERHLIQTFWAPELHIIAGQLYILFAVGAEQWAPKCHMMRLKEGGDPTRAEDWTDPVKVLDKEGQDLNPEGITLDMTYLKVRDRSYLVWSSRINCMAPGDTGSMLYIGEIDEACPERLISDKVLLSRPLYGWENNAGTINNEGPYPLLANNAVYIMYSGGAAGGDSYAVGCLKIAADGDLLNPAEWMKSPTALLASAHFKGIYGPGHNAFTVDENGDVLITYHAQQVPGRGQRCTGIHRVHFGADGRPLLYMTAERDLSPALAEVHTRVTVPGDTAH